MQVTHPHMYACTQHNVFYYSYFQNESLNYTRVIEDQICVHMYRTKVSCLCVYLRMSLQFCYVFSYNIHPLLFWSDGSKTIFKKPAFNLSCLMGLRFTGTLYITCTWFSDLICILNQIQSQYQTCIHNAMCRSIVYANFRNDASTESCKIFFSEKSS